MKKVEVGFVAKRTADGGWVQDRKIYRDVPDEDVGKNGLTKQEENCLKIAANGIFAELIKENPQFRDIFMA